MKKTALILAVILLTACGDNSTPTQKPAQVGKVDDCGYTWRKTGRASDSITIERLDDWRDYPGACRQIGVRGCAVRFETDNHVDTRILIVGSVEESLKSTHACEPVAHEIRHALGYSHDETHSYTPKDHTR